MSAISDILNRIDFDDRFSVADIDNFESRIRAIISAEERKKVVEEIRKELKTHEYSANIGGINGVVFYHKDAVDKILEGGAR